MDMHTQFNSDFLECIAQDIEALPMGAVQLVGALVTLQSGMPKWLEAFIMKLLGQRTDMSRVSPAAEAVMRLVVYSRYQEFEFAKAEMQTQQVLLKTIAMDDKLFVATDFMHTLADRLEGLKQVHMV